MSPSYAADSQAKSSDLASSILAASTPAQIAAACIAIDSFLHKYTPDQSRWFFSITFPTLICKIFGFDESPAQGPQSSRGWIDVVSTTNDTQLADKVFNLLSPNSVLLSSISAADRLSLVKYVFPTERLPEWVRLMFQNEQDWRALADLCPLFKGRVREDSIKGSTFQVHLNVFEYYIFWFAYYPVCRGISDNCDTVRARRSRKFKLENLASSIPGFLSSKRTSEQKIECGLYMRLLHAYLRAYVPIDDPSAHQPYRNSLLHFSSGYHNSNFELAEFFISTLIHFWLVDNDFSPLPVNLCKSFGISFPFRFVLGETPPAPGLGEMVNVFVKYLNLGSVPRIEGSDWVESTGSPMRGLSASPDVVQSRNAVSAITGLHSVGSWNSRVQRPLYRFILRTFLFCPLETSMKSISQVFSLWVNYIEPWNISLEAFADFNMNVSISARKSKEATHSPAHRYSSSWKNYVLSNYLFYSSLVMHFIGFAHKFLHADAEMIVRMVAKVLDTLSSSTELIDLLKNVDAVFHSKPAGSSKSKLSTLYPHVPTIREQLQDWEDGLCESDADGSFLHENWNKDLRLFSDGEDGGHRLLQLFVLRAESELHAISGNNLAENLQCLDSLKAWVACLYGDPIVKPISITPVGRQSLQSRDEIFKPRWVVKHTSADVKYKGDWMKRPISNDEVAWLARLLVNLSGWLNESLGLDKGDSSHVGPSWSYVDVSDGVSNVCGPTETMKVLAFSAGSWLVTSLGTAVRFMRGQGLRVNLRMLASKKVVTALFAIAAFGALKRTFAESCVMV